jgi:hypothetical protein
MFKDTEYRIKSDMTLYEAINIVTMNKTTSKFLCTVIPSDMIKQIICSFDNLDIYETYIPMLIINNCSNNVDLLIKTLDYLEKHMKTALDVKHFILSKKKAEDILSER